MKAIGLILILFTTIVSCKTDKEKETTGYLVNARANNMADSTKVVMYLYPETDVAIDSATIYNETFRFKGEIEKPTLAMLRMEDIDEYKMFWLENSTIEIVGEKGNFSNGSVTGSKAQKEADLLEKRKDSIHQEMDELEEMITESNRDSLLVVYEKMIDKEAEINKTFIEEFPDSHVSLFTLQFGTMRRIGAEETGKLFALMPPELQSTEGGEFIEKFIKLNKNPKVGDVYSDFEQANPKGKPVKFSEIKGKYILLEFWASWCGPCRSENPELVKIFESYKDKGFNIVGVSLDTNREKWIAAIKEDKLPWKNVSDLKGFNNEVALIYGISEIPDNFLIDENGLIIARYLRGDDLKNKLKELFDK